MIVQQLTDLKDLKKATTGDKKTEPTVAAKEVVEQETARVPLEPKIDKFNRAYATGKRKESIARVWIKPGKGEIQVNKRDIANYFPREVLRID